LLTKNECDKILVATKLCPVDWKLDPSAQARRSARSAASANQPATPVPSLGGDTIVSKLTQSIGQGRAFEVGRELVTARRKNEINPAELKPLAQQIVAQLYQDPTAWRERVTDFMRGWAKAAAEERDDWSSREVLSAIDEAAASDPNANGAPKAEHRQGFVTLAPHVLWEEYVDAETVMNEIAGGQENPNLASWKSFIAVDIS
jgi:hypothetical protein